MGRKNMRRRPQGSRKVKAARKLYYPSRARTQAMEVWGQLWRQRTAKYMQKKRAADKIKALIRRKLAARELRKRRMMWPPVRTSRFYGNGEPYA